MNIKKIVSENISSYINNIINESVDEYLNPKQEFLNGLRTSNIKLMFGDNNSFDIFTKHYVFYVDYEITSDAYYDVYKSNDYLSNDEYEVHNENIEFNKINIVYYDLDTNDENVLECDDEIENALNECDVDWDSYDMPSYDDLHFGEYDEE